MRDRGPGSDRPTVAITQVRMTSSRLPGKTLRQMAGRPMLELMLDRLRSGDGHVQHVIATSTDATDDPIEELCQRLDVPCVRGSLEDVLGRYVQALDRFEPAIALRLTGDNPMLDAAAVEGGLEAFAGRSRPETTVGVCNHLADRTDPLGYCVEVFEPDALRRIDAEDRSAEEREHVTLALKRRNQYASFHLLAGDHAGLRWTVDTEEDFRYMDALFRELGPDVTAAEAVAWSRSHSHPGDLDSRARYR